MNTILYAELCQELHKLIDEWVGLQSTPSATERDFMRVKLKIDRMRATISAFRDAA